MTFKPLSVLTPTGYKMEVPYRLKEGQNRQFHELSSGLKMEVISQKKKKVNGEEKPPLVFIHGSFHAAWCWAEHWLPFFSHQGFDCFALSLLAQEIFTIQFSISTMEAKEAGSSLESIMLSFNTRISELQELIIARNMYPGSSIADLTAIDASVKAMELQVQSIKDRLREETLAIPKAKGESDAPADKVVGSLQTHAADIAHFIKEELTSPAVLVEHSFGGLIVQYYVSSMRNKEILDMSNGFPELAGAVLICSVPPSVA